MAPATRGRVAVPDRPAVPDLDPRSPLRALSLALVAALSLAVAGCGSDDDDEALGNVGSDSLTIYSSAPLQGPDRARSQAAIAGMKLALNEAGGRVGRFTVKFVSLDSSTSDGEGWEPEQVAGNARRAIKDRTTIAYLGELENNASAISIPLMNQAGVLQVSPGDRAIGLTRADHAGKGEPDKYYPAGRRTFGRVMPPDHRQAAAQATFQKEEGCERLYVVKDSSPYGRSLADAVSEASRNEDIDVVANESFDGDDEEFRELASDVVLAEADCVFVGATLESDVPQLVRDLRTTDDEVTVFVPDALHEPRFARALGAAGDGVRLTHPTYPADSYPASGEDVLQTLSERAGVRPDPWALYGYEAMKVVLTAIQNAGDRGNNRIAVTDAFFRIEDRESVLGKYSIDANGDTTLPYYGASRIEAGALAFDRVVEID